MGTLASLVVRVGADISNFSTEMGRAAKISEKRSAAIKKSMVRIGASAAAGLAVAINEAAKFQSAMAEVATLLDDTSQVDGLAQSVRELSLEYGKAPVETAKALYQIISAGAGSAKEQMVLLNAANRLAIGGMTEVEIAADGLTGVLNAYGMEATEAGRVSDIMFTTMKLGKTTIAEISAKINEITPLAATLGIEFTEVGAALATVTSITGNTSTATTQLKSIMNAIIAPAEKSKKLWTKMGIEYGRTGIKLAGGLLPFLRNLIDKTGGSDEKLKKMLGSIEGLQGVLALATADFDKFSTALDGTKESLGATDEAVVTVSATFKFQMDKMKAAISVLTETVGTVLLPSVTTIVSAITELATPVKTLEEAVTSASNAAATMGTALRNESDLTTYKNAIKGSKDAIFSLETQIGNLKSKLKNIEPTYHQGHSVVVKLKNQIVALKNKQKILYDGMTAGKSVLIEQENKLKDQAEKVAEVKTETGNLITEQTALISKHKELVKELQPVKTAASEYAETIRSLNELLNANVINEDEFKNGMQAAATEFDNVRLKAAGLDTELEEITVTAKKVPAVAQTMSTAMQGAAAVIENSFKRLDDTFANFWSNLLKDGKFSLKGIKDLFLDTIAQMLHAAITQPIVLKIGAALTGGLASGAASASGGLFGQSWVSGFLGEIGGIGGAAAIGIGGFLGYNLAGGASAAEGIGAAIGATALGVFSGAVGGIIGGPIGAIIGKALGGLVGGLIGSFVGGLFGGDPKITIGGSDSDVGNNVFDSDLGGFRIGGAVDKLAEFSQTVVDSIQQMDGAIASFLDGAQIDKVTAALADWRLRLKGEAISLETILSDRFAVVLSTFSDNVKAYVNTFEGLEDQSTALQAYVTAMNALSVTLMGFIETEAISQFNQKVLNSAEQMAALSTDLSDAFDNFSNTPEELININRLVQLRYQQEIEMLTTIDALIASMAQSIEAQRQSIIRAVNLANGITEVEKPFSEVLETAEGLLNSINEASSPEEIASIIASIQNTTSSAFNNLSGEFQTAFAPALLDLLDRAEEAASNRATELADAVIAKGEELREQARLFGEKFDISLEPVIESTDNITDAIGDQTDDIVDALVDGQNLQRILIGKIERLDDSIKELQDAQTRTVA